MPRVADLRYALRGPRPTLVIRGAVLVHFDRHRQRTRADTEAGGQIFATYEPETITICRATGPYATDDRRRCLFTPDRSREDRDLRRWFRKKQHFLGNWHTHPEAIPRPSRVDVRNTRQRFRESDHPLLAFTMIIVGTNDFPEGLWVSLINDVGHTQLHPVPKPH